MRMALNRPSAAAAGPAAGKKIGSVSAKASGIPSIARPVAKPLDKASSSESGHRLSTGSVDGKSVVTGNLPKSKSFVKEKASVLPGRSQVAGGVGTVTESGIKTGVRPPATTTVHSINEGLTTSGKVPLKTATKARQNSPKVTELSIVAASEHHRKSDATPRVSSLPQPAASIAPKMGAKAPSGGTTVNSRTGATLSSGRQSAGGSSSLRNGTVPLVKGKSPLSSSSNVTTESSQTTRKGTGISKLQSPVIGRSRTGNSLKAKSILPSATIKKAGESKLKSNVTNSKTSVVVKDVSSNLKNVQTENEIALHKSDDFCALPESDSVGGHLFLDESSMTAADESQKMSSDVAKSSIDPDGISSFGDASEETSEYDQFSESRSDLCDSANYLIDGASSSQVSLINDLEDEATGESVKMSSVLKCDDEKFACVSTDDIFASCEDISEQANHSSDLTTRNSTASSSVDHKLDVNDVDVATGTYRIWTPIVLEGGEGGGVFECLGQPSLKSHSLEEKGEGEDLCHDELKISEEEDEDEEKLFVSSLVSANRQQEQVDAIDVVTGNQIASAVDKDSESELGNQCMIIAPRSDLDSCHDNATDDLNQDTGNKRIHVKSHQDKNVFNADENEKVDFDVKVENNRDSLNEDKKRCHYEDVVHFEKSVGTNVRLDAVGRRQLPDANEDGTERQVKPLAELADRVFESTDAGLVDDTLCQSYETLKCDSDEDADSTLPSVTEINDLLSGHRVPDVGNCKTLPIETVQHPGVKNSLPESSGSSAVTMTGHSESPSSQGSCFSVCKQPHIGGGGGGRQKGDDCSSSLPSSDVKSSRANYSDSGKHQKGAAAALCYTTSDYHHNNNKGRFYQDVDQNRANECSGQLSSSFVDEFSDWFDTEAVLSKRQLNDRLVVHAMNVLKPRNRTDDSSFSSSSLHRPSPSDAAPSHNFTNAVDLDELKMPNNRDAVDSATSKALKAVYHNQASEGNVFPDPDNVDKLNRNSDLRTSSSSASSSIRTPGSCKEDISRMPSANLPNIGSETFSVTSKKTAFGSVPATDNDSLVMKRSESSVINKKNVEKETYPAVIVQEAQDLDRCTTLEVQNGDNASDLSDGPASSDQNPSTTTSQTLVVNHSLGIRKDVHCLQRAPSPLRVLTNHLPGEKENPMSSTNQLKSKLIAVTDLPPPQMNVFKFRPLSLQDDSVCSSSDSVNHENLGSVTVSSQIVEKDKLLKDANQNVVLPLAEAGGHVVPLAFMSSHYVPSRPLSQFCSRTMSKSLRRNNDREGNSGLSSVESLPTVHSAGGEPVLPCNMVSDISAQIRFARSCSRIGPKSPSHLTSFRGQFSSTPKVHVSGSLPSFELCRSPSGRTLSSTASLSSSRTNSSRQSECSTPVIGDSRSQCTTPTLMGSCSTSTVEEPDSFIRPGTEGYRWHDDFSKNLDEDVHGSFTSLVSSASSSFFSTVDEKQSVEMRKLKQELEVAKEKIESLTTQLNVNTVMSKTYEQNIESLTQRLKLLTTIIDQKESELYDLRSALKNVSASATESSLQTIPDFISLGSNFVRKSPLSSTLPLEARTSGPRCAPVLTRHMSCESVNSVNSQSSSCSRGSQQSASVVYPDKKKKSKKGWLKSSISKAFSRKKTKQGEFDALSICSDNSNTDPHPHPSLVMEQCSTSLVISKTPPDDSTQLFEENGSTEELQEKLREADIQLTDLRLESLASLQLIEQLHENVSSLEQEVVSLRAENKSLQRIIMQQGSSSAGGGRGGGTALQKRFPEISRHASLCSSSTTLMSPSYSVDGLLKATSSPVSAAAQNTSSPKLLQKFRLTVDSDSLCKQIYRVCVYVARAACGGNSEEEKNEKTLGGQIGVLMLSEQTSWQDLDLKVGSLFVEHVRELDPESGLGLDEKSIASYQLGDHTRTLNSEYVESRPEQFLRNDINASINIYLRDWQEDGLDFLAFDTLVPRPFLQQYLSLLLENRRVLFCGPSLTGKTFLAKKLARHLVLRKEKKLSSNSVAHFTVDSKSSKELEQYLSNIVILSEQASERLPSVIVIDNLHLADNLSKAFSGFFSLDSRSCPYVIGTMTQSRAASLTCLQFHQNFRWVLFNPHEEPVKSFLARFLQRQLTEKHFEFEGEDDDCSLQRVIDWMPKVWHHVNKFVASTCSADKCIGPGIFLPCPSDTEKARAWFVDLWNYSIGPYLLQLIKDSFSQGGSNKTVCKDPTDWVLETAPWTNRTMDGGSLPLRRLHPNHDASVAQLEERQVSSAGATKQFSQSSTDPLLDMLLQLQVSTCYSDSVGKDKSGVSSLSSSFSGMPRLNTNPTTLHSVTS